MMQRYDAAEKFGDFKLHKCLKNKDLCMYATMCNRGFFIAYLPCFDLKLIKKSFIEILQVISFQAPHRNHLNHMAYQEILKCHNQLLTKGSVYR